MKTVTTVFGILTIWILFGILLTLAIIYDGIYIQLTFDAVIMFVSGTIGYLIKRKFPK